MGNLGEKLANLSEKVNKLESSSLVLSEAIHCGNNSVESYSGAMDLLYEGITELVDLCKELCCVCS